MLHLTGLHGAVPGPAVAVPVGNCTTQHSHTVSHGGHALAALLWEAPDSGTCLGWALLTPSTKGQLVEWVLAMAARACRSEVVLA